MRFMTLNCELSASQTRYFISTLLFSICVLHDPFVNLLYCPRICVSYVNFVFCAVHLRTKRLSIWFQVNKKRRKLNKVRIRLAKLTNCRWNSANQWLYYIHNLHTHKTNMYRLRNIQWEQCKQVTETNKWTKHLFTIFF